MWNVWDVRFDVIRPAGCGKRKSAGHNERFDPSALPKHQRGGVLEKNVRFQDDSLAAKPEGIRGGPRCLEPSGLKWPAAVQIGHPNSRFVLPETGSDRASPWLRPGCCIFYQILLTCPTFWCNLAFTLLSESNNDSLISKTVAL